MLTESHCIASTGRPGSIGNSVINNTICQAADVRWAVNIKNQSTSNKVVNLILYFAVARVAASNIAERISLSQIKQL